MTTTAWALKGLEYGHCNCDYGCPCQFNGRPSSRTGPGGQPRLEQRLAQLVQDGRVRPF